MKENEVVKNKEALPIDFITTFVSSGWDKIGQLKTDIKGIKDTFTNTAKVEQILQNLLDSYLIAVGQMELCLDNKKYLDVPTEADLKKQLSEASCIAVLRKESEKPEAAAEIKGDVDDKDDTHKETEKDIDEYFVDFEDPEPDEEADNAVKAWLNK